MGTRGEGRRGSLLVVAAIVCAVFVFQGSGVGATGSTPSVTYGGLEALPEATGHVIWTNDSASLPDPALARHDLFTATSCRDVVALHRDTGKLDWQHNTNCSGGITVVPQYADGKVFVLNQV